jgi:gamma-glutamylcyclotransferase (GGCT)/AIG2-like uncharacterized protein YtfP
MPHAPGDALCSHAGDHSGQKASSRARLPDRLSTDPEALFAYGSLLFPEVVQALLGRIPESTPAAVAGWRVAALPGRVYPALVAAEALAKGHLLAGLTRQEWRIIDAFEDHLYDLRRLTLTDGRHGWAYLYADASDVSPDDWDANRFEQHDLAAFVGRCTAWRQRYEASTSE